MLPESITVLLIGGVTLVHTGIWAILIANLVYLREPSVRTPNAWPSLSVCIPARNEGCNLRRLLPSLLAQTYPDLEIHVWDDGSDDDTGTVLDSYDDGRLHTHRTDAPPDGWLGKVHALHQCTRQASGSYYLFLDADAELTGQTALRRIVARHLSTGGAVSSGFPRLRGGGQLLVSLVSYTFLTGLPWRLVERTYLPSLSALNGQCWMIDAEVYHTLEPHETVHDRILEDVAIGRFLKRHGHPPALIDIRNALTIHMYDDLTAAWRGFRKNLYLLLGGRPASFLPLWCGFVLFWIVAPLLSPWFLGSLYGLKAVTDRWSGFSPIVTILAPLSFVLGCCLQLDSAVHHWTNRVQWKGRHVSASSSTE